MTSVSVRMDVGLRDDLERLASDDSRPLAQYIRVILERHVREMRAPQEMAAREVA